MRSGRLKAFLQKLFVRPAVTEEAKAVLHSNAAITHVRAERAIGVKPASEILLEAKPKP
jgi:hypothetical protein